MTPTIYVIDDDGDLRLSVSQVLGDAGYRVESFGSARQALAHLEAGERPALIVLDLMMPEMNGWQFLERADSILGSIPVVIMTARKAADLHQPPSRHVLHKPFDGAKLLSTIARYAARS